MAKYRTNLILGKTRMENGFTTRSQKDVEEDVESVRRGNLGDTQLLLANQQPAGSSLFCVVPEGRARLEGFSDREADCRERAVPRMCPKGFRAHVLCGAVLPHREADPLSQMWDFWDGSWP